MSSRRLIVRAVDEVAEIIKAKRRAEEIGKATILCAHGGGVANSYGYRASTEAVVTVAWPDGLVWQSDVERLPANKVTYAGAFRACTSYGVLFDDRFSDAKKSAARAKFLAVTREQAESELQRETA